MGRKIVHGAPGTVHLIAVWPRRVAFILALGTFLAAASCAEFARLDIDAEAPPALMAETPAGPAAPAAETPAAKASTAAKDTTQPGPRILGGRHPVSPVEREGGVSGANRFPGTDDFIGAPRVRVEASLRDGDLILNFENAQLQEVVKVVLGNTLKVNYVFDARVQGIVTLKTTRPLPAAATIELLETLLRMNGAALIVDEDIYRVVPADEAVRGNLVPELAPDGPPIPFGFAVRVVPLEFISAAQMEKILEPFVPAEGIIRVDVDRNLVILAGTGAELARMMETVDIFDVDWLAGMSVGIFPLAHVSAESVADELEAVFGSDAEGPLAGLIRFKPIKRLNALLVVTSQSLYLKKAETWIGRLDRGTTTGQNLYVYYLQNGKAVDLAKILTEVFDARKESRDQPAGSLAPGLKPVELASPAATGQRAADKKPAQKPATIRPLRKGAERVAAVTGPGRKSERLAFDRAADVTIIADEVNNALLILASAQDYSMVEAAIRKLDIVPLQVLIEATIAEVTLTDQLRFGVQWFFKNGGFGGNNTGTGTLSSGTSAALASTFPGFSYVVSNAVGSARFILDALDSVTKVNVISSPLLMVQDNQSAELQVGDEVPVVTQQQQNTDSTASLVNTVQFRDTGVILRVTPRVNAGGSINMEVEQEVSNVVATADTSLTPTISQRKIKSSVVVQSGETMVLGGLIDETKTKTHTGIPFLSRIPILGSLFGSDSETIARTELIVLISPRVVRNQAEARRVTREVRQRLKGLRPDEANPDYKPKPGG